jgi:hypothetical protein
MANTPMPAKPRSQHLPDQIGWHDQLAECFCAIRRRVLERMLAGAAYISAHSDHEGCVQHHRNVSVMLANAKALCVISHSEAQAAGWNWVRTEAEIWLYTLSPVTRRTQLLDPEGPQRFLTLKRRTQMLREIDDEMRWGKRTP